METLKDPVQNWNLMTWEQMRDVAQVWYGADDEATKRLKVLCILVGCELVGKEYATPIVDKLLVMKDKEVEQWLRENVFAEKGNKEWDEVMKECQGVMDENGKRNVLLRDKSTGETLAVDSDNIGSAAYKFTEFLDKPNDLRHIPLSDIKIGRHTYVFPEVALTDVRFDQFQDIQKYEEHVWEGLERVNSIVEDMEALDHDPSPEYIANKTSEINDTLAEVKEMKSQMLAAMLKRKVWKGFKAEFCNSLPFISIRSRYETVYAEDAVKDMTTAPEWLFSICEMFLQGSIGFYAGQYPKVFKKAGGGKDAKAPLIARTDTIRALMKYQGFGRLEDVKNMLLPEAFSVMNAMSEESEEVEKMRKR